MRSLITAIVFAFTVVSVLAVTDPQPHVSPDGRYSIHNIGDTAEVEKHFEIRTREGEVLLTTSTKLK